MLEPARESDWIAVRRLSVQIHDLHASWRPDIYCHSEAPYPQEAFPEDVSNEQVYLYRLNGNVAGYVVLKSMEKRGPGVVERSLLRVDSICVDKACRGRGIGKAMMEDVFSIAKERGCDDVILGVHPENKKAIGFYQKCGFAVRTINMEKAL